MTIVLLIWLLISHVILCAQFVALRKLSRRQGWWQRLWYHMRWSMTPAFVAHSTQCLGGETWWSIYEPCARTALAADLAALDPPEERTTTMPQDELLCQKRQLSNFYRQARKCRLARLQFSLRQALRRLEKLQHQKYEEERAHG